MPEGRQAARWRAKPWAGRPWNVLLAKFLLLLTPIFLVLAIPSIGLLVHHQLRVDQEGLAARIGNSAARTATALRRHDPERAPRLARDMMAALAADRAFLCAEVVSGPDRRVVVAQPPRQGCRTVTTGYEITLPVDAKGRLKLLVRFNDAELREAKRLQHVLAFSAVGIAFILAVLASFIGFRMIVTRPLRLLTVSIRHAAETGDRQPVDFESRDELGVVIAAYNEMLAHDAEREGALKTANRKLQESQAELRRLNQALESRVAERTEALNAEKLRVEAANRAKSQFLANTSHELRTPLNAIIGFSEAMNQELLGPLGDPQYRQYARDIHDSGTHLLSLINDILDLSKIEAGRMELVEESVVIGDIVDASVRIIRDRARAAEVDLVTDLPSGLPMLHADRRALKQILLNLLSNAVKFSVAGGRVTIAARHNPSGGLTLDVSDKGVGMSTADVQKALAPFGQADGSLARKYEGTGLGLPLSKALVEIHGGSLTLDSRPDAGTTVSVFFPEERLLQTGNRARSARRGVKKAS